MLRPQPFWRLRTPVSLVGVVQFRLQSIRNRGSRAVIFRNDRGEEGVESDREGVGSDHGARYDSNTVRIRE
jgi:hypothetical protein